MAERIVAPDGAALHAAVIGAADLDRSLAFYRDLIGLQVIDDGELSGADFERFWHLPPGTRARYAALAERGGLVGRIVLIDVAATDRLPIRDIPDESAYGLMNVNFYVQDIAAMTGRIEAAGFPAWSAPIRHVMAPHIGSPTEVMFDGPDTVIVNLVELSTSDPVTRIGQMRAYVAEDFGYNARGFTPVVTTQHAVHDTDDAVRFYRDVCGMAVLFTDVIASPEQNHFSRYPEGSSTRTTFMQGNHMFGKVAINEPLDYPCVSMAAAAVLPNIGYVAQAFVIPDLAAAIARAEETEVYAPPATIRFPGLGKRNAAMLRNPGSGALMLLIEES